IVRAAVVDLELTGTSETARAEFERAMNLFCSPPVPAMAPVATSSGVENPSLAAAQTRLQSAAPGDKSGALAGGNSLMLPRSRLPLSQSVPKTGQLNLKGPGPVSVASGSMPTTEVNSHTSVHWKVLAPPLQFPGSSSLAPYLPAPSTATANALEPRFLSSPATERSLPSPARAEGLSALAKLLGALESRFFTRNSSTSQSGAGGGRGLSAQVDKGTTTMSAEVAVGGDGGGMSASVGKAAVAPSVRLGYVSGGRGVAASSGSDLKGRNLEGVRFEGTEGHSWTISLCPLRAEEILVDLLDREKVNLPQLNRDNARADETRLASMESPGATGATALPGQVRARGMTLTHSPRESLSPTKSTSAGNSAPGRVVSTAPTGAMGLFSPLPHAFTGPSSSHARGEPTPPLSRSVGIAACHQIQSSASVSLPGGGMQPPKNRCQASARGDPPREFEEQELMDLGKNASIFAMIVRGAVLTGRHELALLVASGLVEIAVDSLSKVCSSSSLASPSPSRPVTSSTVSTGGGTSADVAAANVSLHSGSRRQTPSRPGKCGTGGLRHGSALEVALKGLGARGVGPEKDSDSGAVALATATATAIGTAASAVIEFLAQVLTRILEVMPLSKRVSLLCMGVGREDSSRVRDR
ncbi:unnamed protein product, partial [Choristocarpus tenellus]